MITEQQAKEDTMDLAIAVANAMKKQRLDAAIAKDYKESGNDPIALGDAIIHVMDMVTKAFPKQPFPNYLLMTCGTLIMQMIAQSFALKGIKPLTQEQQVKVQGHVFHKYMQMHPEIDLKWVGQQLKELQGNLANGKFAKVAGSITKTDPSQIQNTINGKSQGLLGKAGQ